MPVLRVLTIVLLALSFSGCGTRFMYSQLDWLIPWQLRDFISLDDGQQAHLETLVLERLDWHCQTQLPSYAEWLLEIEADLQADRVDARWLAERSREAEAFWAILMQQLSSDAAAILATATEPQLQELFSNLDARTREQLEQYVNRPEQVLVQERADRIEQRLRRWFGRMNREQRALIEAWSEDLGLFAQDWLDNRGRWQAQFRDAVTQNRGRPDVLKPALEQLLVHPEKTWSRAYSDLVAFQRERTWSLLADLYQLAPDRQRERLISRVSQLAGDFEHLSCAENGSPANDDR